LDNYWSSQKEQMATWVARLTPVRDDPARLVDWAATVADAGERHRVYVLEKAPSLGYDRSQHGPYGPFLRRRYAETGEVDAYVPGFTSPVLFWAELAYAGAGGEVVTEPVYDTGILAQRLHPDADDSTVTYNMRSRVPFLIDGRSYGGQVPELKVEFTVYSDIWFPWVQNWIDDDRFNHVPVWDNRPLARVHTPRLNAFLGEARGATVDAGGGWEVDHEECHLAPAAVGAGGIDLDQPRPTWIDSGPLFWSARMMVVFQEGVDRGRDLFGLSIAVDVLTQLRADPRLRDGPAAEVLARSAAELRAAGPQRDLRSYARWLGVFADALAEAALALGNDGGDALWTVADVLCAIQDAIATSKGGPVPNVWAERMTALLAAHSHGMPYFD
jgi:hypothetical protein